MKKISFLLIIISLISLNISCGEEKADLTAITESSEAEYIFSNIFSYSEQNVRDTLSYSISGVKTTNANSPFITIFKDSNAIDTWIMITDFGNSGIICQDGNTRAGVIRTVLVGDYRNMGSTITNTLQHYVFNGLWVEGIQVATNLGRNMQNNIEYDIVVTDGIIHKSAGLLYWSKNATREWIVGENTYLNVWDDEYMINGNIVGTASNGIPFTVTTTQQLHYAVNCPWIQSGELLLQDSIGNQYIVDYGNDNCDSQIDVMFNGITYNINI